MSDAGLLAFREPDEAFRLTERGSALLSDCRQGKNTQHTILALLPQGVYGRLAGYEDVNDADRLRVDPAMRQVMDTELSAHAPLAALLDFDQTSNLCPFSKSVNTFDGPRCLHAESKSRVA